MLTRSAPGASGMASEAAPPAQRLLPDATIDLSELPLIGGRLCLDFVNTLDWRASAQAIEFFHTYADLLAWGQYAGALSLEEMQRLHAHASERPDDAAATLSRAVQFREATFRLLAASVDDAPVSAADLALVNAEIATALAQLRLNPHSSGFAWTWREGDALDRVLWPVARSLSELLTAPELARIRICDGEGCGWLFLDTSRNRSRRWCRMQGCGNRAKARRYYARRGGSAQD
jgi:predicted RNA-binding Zn ribbon-like protein